MSYTLRAYLIDMEHLQAVIGSRNESLASAVCGRCADEIAPFDGLAADEIQCGAPTLKQAIVSLVYCPPQSSEHPDHYGYALECICKCLGEELPNDLFQECQLDYERDVGLLERFYNAGLPVSMPKPVSYPAIGHLAYEDARKWFAELETADLTVGGDTVTAGREQVRDWLEEATRTRKGIVIFAS